MVNLIPELAGLNQHPDLQEPERSDLAAAFKALSDPTRLRIFDLLMDGALCNCELAERLGISLSLISHHLRALRQVGLVDSERDPQDARWIIYSVNAPAVTAVWQHIERLLDLSRVQPRTTACSDRVRCEASDSSPSPRPNTVDPSC
jgi:ArsR family transcriptional regulator